MCEVDLHAWQDSSKEIDEKQGSGKGGHSMEDVTKVWWSVTTLDKAVV
jgi:hypothetical protein